MKCNSSLNEVSFSDIVQRPKHFVDWLTKDSVVSMVTRTDLCFFPALEACQLQAKGMWGFTSVQTKNIYN